MGVRVVRGYKLLGKYTFQWYRNTISCPLGWLSWKRQTIPSVGKDVVEPNLVHCSWDWGWGRVGKNGQLHG